jgi:GNAT superfamily N-acetyltransferase
MQLELYESRCDLGAIKFEYDVPLEETMAFEAVYPAALQLDLSEKKKMFDETGSIFVWMFVDGQLAGESYGIPLSSSDELLVAEFPDLAEYEKQDAIDCYSNTILPAFQNRGLGTILKAHWLGLAVAKGYKVVYGFARPGASQSLNANFGAVFLQDFPNWYGSNETYKRYRLALR